MIACQLNYNTHGQVWWYHRYDYHSSAPVLANILYLTTPHLYFPLCLTTPPLHITQNLTHKFHRHNNSHLRGWLLPLNRSVSIKFGHSSCGWLLELDKLKSTSSPDCWRFDDDKVIISSSVVTFRLTLFWSHLLNDNTWLILQSPRRGTIFQASVTFTPPYWVSWWLSSNWGGTSPNRDSLSSSETYYYVSNNNRETDSLIGRNVLL